MASDIVLREVTEADLPTLFEQQRDPVANQMAAFPARDREAFMAHWTTKILVDPTSIVRTILWNGHLVGNVLSWEHEGQRYIGYWLGRDYWGRGIATRAVSDFLQLVKTRPLHAQVAKHNPASVRVLQKCGFTISGEGSVPWGAPGESVEDYALTLAAPEQ